MRAFEGRSLKQMQVRFGSERGCCEVERVWLNAFGPVVFWQGEHKVGANSKAARQNCVLEHGEKMHSRLMAKARSGENEC